MTINDSNEKKNVIIMNNEIIINNNMKMTKMKWKYHEENESK